MQKKMISFSRALNSALVKAMNEDESVVLLGEDIGLAGGSFGVTRGLLDQYGSKRVIDTPISEAAIAGSAVGAALSGLKPVIEIMFMDFSTLVMDAIVNQAAKARFMSGGQASVPLVLRTPHGGGVSAGPQHSQCLEAWFAHVPGLKVVCPSDPASAHGLLLAAIDDPNPIIFIENKALYSMKAELHPEIGFFSLGKAQVLREGEDVSLITYGAAVHTCLEAAAKMSSNGFEIEVVDLCTLQPWDQETVLNSLKKTNRLIIVHEAVEAFGIGAEIAAGMANIGFDYLDAPIQRVGAPFMPVPFSKNLEQAYLPSVSKVEQAVKRIVD